MKRFLLLGLLACSVLSAGAQKITELSAQTRAVIEKGPLLTAVTGDGFTVVWQSSMDAIGRVEVAPVGNEHFYNRPRAAFFDLKDGIKKIGRHHVVRVTGLKPGTRYLFRISNIAVRQVTPKSVIYGEVWGTAIKGDVCSVTTLDPGREQCRFQVVNDIHNEDSLLRKLLFDVVETKTDLVILNGDMQHTMQDNDQIFGGHLQAVSDLFGKHIPFYMARGNHESFGAYAHKYLDYYPTSTGESFYAFRQGPAAFVVLDGTGGSPGNEKGFYGMDETEQLFERQKVWLENVLSSPEFKSAPRKILITHFPLAGNAELYGVRRMKELYLDMLNGAGFDIGFAGHTHRYKWTGAGTDGVRFPILTNSNKEKITVDVTARAIHVKTFDASGKMTHQHDLEY